MESELIESPAIIELSKEWGCCLCLTGFLYPCSCTLCYADDAEKRTYVHVHKDRIEVNYPGYGLNQFDCQHIYQICNCGICCLLPRPQCGVYICGGVRDNIHVFRFGINPMTNKITPVSLCDPGCTHCTLFPDCGRCCGGSVILHSGNGDWVVLPGLNNPESAAQIMIQARDSYNYTTAMYKTPQYGTV